MASLTYYPNGLTSIGVILLLLLILPLHLTSSSSRPVGMVSSRTSYSSDNMVIGSRPPHCVNRCSSCRPCMAALVAPPHHIKSPSSHEDEGYYLLAWKCKCGNRYYQP